MAELGHACSSNFLLCISCLSEQWQVQGEGDYPPPPPSGQSTVFSGARPPPHPPSRHVPMAHTPGNPRSPSQSLCCFPCKMNIISVTKFITISVTEYVISVTISFRPLYSAQFMCCGQVSPTVLFKERKHYIIALHCILSL